MEEDHSCCNNDKKQEQLGKDTKRLKTLRSYTVGAGAAFLACLCCSLPLIPLMIGFGGATIFTEQLGQYHLAFELGAIIILMAFCVHMWKEHHQSGKPLHSFALQVLVTFAMYAIMTFAMQALLAPVFAGLKGMQMKNHKH